VEAKHIWTGRTTREKFLEPDCLIRARVGRLKEVKQDVWYEMTEQTVVDALHEQVKGDIVTYVLPFLDQMESLETIIDYLLHQRQLSSGCCHRICVWLSAGSPAVVSPRVGYDDFPNAPTANESIKAELA
jgi:hypothetical protein